MFRKSFVILKQCRSARSMHTAFNRRTAVHSPLLHKNPHYAPTKLLPCLSQITVRFSSSEHAANGTLTANTESSSNESSIPFSSQTSETIGDPYSAETSSTVEFSTSTEAISNEAVDPIVYIPPPPAPPESFMEIPVNVLGEATFASYGLGEGWWPPSLMLNALEQLHVLTGMPWWATIAAATVLIRTILFPMVIKQQHHSANLNNSMPTVQRLQKQVQAHKTSGNFYEGAKASQELQEYIKNNDANPLKGFVLPLLQAPIFISFFVGLRKCTNLPVDSFKEGGCLWFTDLTLMDPYYGLPLMTSLTMFTVLKLGIDGPTARQGGMVAKGILYGIPVVMFPFVMTFPSAILCYWLSTNMASLVQVSFLRYPAVREYFKIPERVVHPKEAKKPINVKGFVKDFRKDMVAQKIASEIAERAQYDDVRFKDASKGPIIKTYKTNPLTHKVKSQP